MQKEIIGKECGIEGRGRVFGLVLRADWSYTSRSEIQGKQRTGGYHRRTQPFVRTRYHFGIFVA